MSFNFPTHGKQQPLPSLMMIVSTSITEKETDVITLYHCTAGELSLERDTYNVIESEGSVEICLVLTGGVMSEDTDIILEVSPITARSRSEWKNFCFIYFINYVSSLVDYSIAEDPFIFLTLPRNTSRICTRINIINGTIWEDLYEYFTVKIKQIISEVSALRVNTDPSTIRIQDDDC